jgi:hypothetical protein
MIIKHKHVDTDELFSQEDWIEEQHRITLNGSGATAAAVNYQKLKKVEQWSIRGTDAATQSAAGVVTLNNTSANFTVASGLANATIVVVLFGRASSGMVTPVVEP